MFRTAALIHLLAAWDQSHGFTVPHSAQSRRHHVQPEADAGSIRLKSNPRDFDNEDEVQFFDDFGDSFIGNSSPLDQNDGLMASLQTKIIQTQESEAAYDSKLMKNWRNGNWSVRGFSLAKEKEERLAAVHVSAVAAPISASLAGMDMADDNTLPEYRTVAVARTYGSVFLVRLGKDYLTKFASEPMLVENVQGEDLSAHIEDKWVEQDQIRPQDETKLQPFEVLLDFQSSDSGEECHSIVFHDLAEEDGNNGYICTASGDSGVIHLWTLPLPGQKLQSTTLSEGHHARMVALRTAVVRSVNDRKEQHLLISISCDGTVAFWDLSKQGKLLLSCQFMGGKNEDASLTCADVSNPSLECSYSFGDSSKKTSPDMIFIGTSDGYVMGYNIRNILTTGKCEEPDISFRAHGTDSGKGQGITAIKCGGDGTIQKSSSGSEVRRSPEISSSILLTGGEDGSVKQWEIMTQSSASGVRMEHWPRLATQRMKDRAHLFTPGHDGKVTALSQRIQYDSTTFLSCGVDGTVCIWDAASGELLYRMDGLTSAVSSLACFGRDLLVTDGMDDLVCVHDFSVDEDIALDSYELDW